MPNEVWVWLEQREGTVSETCFELASAGKQLAQNLNAGLTAILVGYHLDNSLHSGLTDRIITVDHERLCTYQPRTYTQVVKELIEWDPPLLLIFPGTNQSNDLAPRVSFLAATLNSQKGKVRIDNASDFEAQTKTREIGRISFSPPRPKPKNF